MRIIKSKIVTTIIVIALISTFSVASSACSSSNHNAPINILEHMKDGMEDKVTRAIFEEDITDIMTFSNSKTIWIWYYDYDLNDDGHMDKITYVVSPFHSGSGGDSFWVWINDGNGEYILSNTLTVPLLGDARELRTDTIVSISKTKTNGFYDIEFSRPDNRFSLKYDAEKAWYDWYGND